MSEIKLISPILDGFIVGDPISDRNGVRSCPAINESNEEKCIVKVISVPPSSTQLDALLLSGAYATKEDALKYYEGLSADIIQEVETLKKLSELEGFMPFTAYQSVPMDDGNGFDVYLLNSYKLSLARKLNKETMTHLGALNLGLDLCAALSVCRRLGYIYVDLKPENIYLTTDNGYRIGDIGFLKLDSLRYASLPDRYRSAYTAPELSDPLSPLNTTIDVYAVGLVLYQAFNGGVLPTIPEDGAPLPPPDYADYEMAEIILKACATDPAARWEDPMQFGNALVGYMQRNGAHDTPIVPPAVAMQEVSEPVAETSEITDDAEDAVPAVDENAVTLEEDETLPGADVEDLDYDEVSDEVNEILTQADDLIAHETPDPVQQPEPIDVQLPAEISADAEPEQDSDSNSDTESSAEVQENNIEASEDVADESPAETSESDTVTAQNDDVTAEADTETIEDTAETKPKRRWIAVTVIIAVIALLITAGILYYHHFYIQHIQELNLDGNGTELTVYVNTDFDESKLTVICSDMYDQNQREASVVNGIAHFTDLPLGSPFTISIKASGFHALKGETTKTYVTPKATQVNDLVALTGPEDGSVNISFSVSGPDSAEWTVTYSADGEETTTVPCVEHTASIPALSIGKEYTFRLHAEDVQLMDSEYIIKYTPSISVIAKDLHINRYEDGNIAVSWSSSNTESTSKWLVRCYNNAENAYNESITTTETQATFDGLTENDTYTLEIRAENMSQVAIFTVPANPIRIQDFEATTENGVTVLSWSCANDGVDNNWFLHCSNQESFAYNEAIDDLSVSLVGLVPGIEYHFMLSHDDSDVSDALVGNCFSYQVPDAESFNNYDVQAEDIAFELCLTPAEDDEEAYVPTNTFTVGQKAYMGVNLGSSVRRPDEEVTIQFVIKNETGLVVDSSVNTENWGELWTRRGTGKLHLPYLPDMPGNYTIDIYFDGALAMTDVFSITES